MKKVAVNTFVRSTIDDHNPEPPLLVPYFGTYPFCLDDVHPLPSHIIMKLLVILLLLLAIGIPSAEGQFGVANKAKEKTKDDSSEPGKLQEAAVDERGNLDYAQYEGMAKKLQSVAPISIEDATDIAVLLEAVKADAETGALIAQMQNAEGTGGGALAAFIKDITPLEIVVGLKQSIDEIKAIEILFADPQRAVFEMDKEGVIEKKRVDFYKKNPDVLKEDTRKGNYFTFVSLAVAGGYL
jgi:hypothetical protein